MSRRTTAPAATSPLTATPVQAWDDAALVQTYILQTLSPDECKQKQAAAASPPDFSAYFYYYYIIIQTFLSDIRFYMTKPITNSPVTTEN